MIHRKIILFLLTLLSTGAFAQYSGSANTFWKNQRHTIGFGVGFVNFLGELGGRNQIGSDFIYDLEWKETKPSLQINYRYQITKRLYAKAQLGFGFVGGNDALTEEIYRRNRNLHFRSTIYELSAFLEFDVLNFTSGSRYSRVNSSQKRGSSLYVTLGVGATRFNPKANFDGKWYSLKDMGTEGQGQVNGPSDYSLFTFVVPFGLGYRYQLNKEWTIGVEIVNRITFTDYMDDVSTVYFDNDIIMQNNGELAAYFADPSLGYYVDDNGVEHPMNSTETGYQRGDPDDNDSYFSVMINATYKLPQKKRRGRGRTVKRRSRRVLF